MAATITDTPILTKPVNVIFQRKFLSVAKTNCPCFAGSMPANLTQHAGSFTASWRRYENLTVDPTALTELNTTVSFPTRDSITPTISDVTSAVSKYGSYIVLNEEADLVNFNGQTAELLDRQAIQSGRTLNQLQRNELEDNSTKIYAGAVASDGLVTSKITALSLNSAINALARNDALSFMPASNGSTNVGTVPILPAYIGLCHPDVSYDLDNLGGTYTSVEKYAGQVATMQGEIGLYKGAGRAVRFVESSDMSIDVDSGVADAGGSTGLRVNSGNVDLYTVVIFGQEFHGSLGFGMEHVQEIYRAGDQLPAVQIIQHGYGSAGPADPLNELSTLGWKTWHAAKIMNGTWGRGIRCGATSL